MEPISLDTNKTTPQETISLDPNNSTVALPPDVSDKRARKIEFGLGPVTGMNKDQAAQAITMGQEPQLRKSQADFLDAQKLKQKSQLLTGLMKNFDSLTDDQVKFVNDKYTMANLMGQQPPTDPHSVMEDYYAGEYLKPMHDISDQFTGGSFMPQAQKEVPDHVENIKQFGHSIIETNEIIRTKLEDAKAKVARQSTLGWGLDFAKGLVPGYNEVKLRGNTDDVGFFNGLRGTNLMEQARSDWRLPPEELKARLNSPQMKKLETDNPQVAVEYYEAMLGYSTSKENLNNAFTLLDASAIPALPIGRALLSGGKAAIRGAAEATGVTAALERKVDLINQTLTATKDVVKSTEGTGPTFLDQINRQYGENINSLEGRIQSLKERLKEPPSMEGGLAETDNIPDLIKGLEQEKIGWQSWYIDTLKASGSSVEEQLENLSSMRVNQVVDKDPVVASAEGRGDLKTAAIENATKQSSEELQGVANREKNTAQALTDNINTMQTTFESNPGRGGQEIVNRLREDTDNFTKRLINAVNNIVRVQRIRPILANKIALEQIRDYTKELYPGLRNAILNISDPIYNRALSSYTQKMYLGRSTGEMFASKEEAQGFAKLNRLDGTANEIQKGMGWYLEVSRPLDETMKPIRDWLVKTKETQTPGGWLNAAVGWLRTGEDTLSREQSIQRKLATINTSPFMQFAKDSMKDVKELGSLKNIKNAWSNWKEWERTVDYARSAPDPKDPTIKGHFFDTGQDLDDFYLRSFNRFPSNTEKAAYFNFKRISEYDRVLRSMSLYRNKSRLGVESHAISVYNEAGEKLQSPFFDGVIRSEMPGGTHTLMIVGGKKDGGWVGAANAMPPKMREKLKDDIQKGVYKVIEVYDPSSKPLNGFANAKDARVRWVVTKNADTRGISVTDQVPYRGGGHFDYDYEHYIKQANIRFDEVSNSHWYEGDTTLMPISLRAQGEDVVSRLNKIRELIKSDKIDEAKTLATSAEGFPAIPWDEHYGWYMPSKNSLGRAVPPRLNKDEPFHVLSKDTSIGNVDNSLQARFEQDADGNAIHGYYDGTREGSLAKTGQVQYTQPRDSYEMYSLRDVGSRNNPLYSYEPAKLIDPITTMNRSLSQIVNSTFMDDYKIYSVESWIQEAKPWLSTGNRKLTDIDRSPYYYFSKPEWKRDAEKATPDIIRRLMGAKLKIDQLVGIPNKTDTFIHSMSQAMSDTIYSKLGPKGSMIDPAWMLPSLTDPTRFARAIVFNAKMGLFSIPQVFVHASTVANVFGIAGPKNAFKGSLGAFMHGLGAVNQNESILNWAGKITEAFGWRPGEWQESFDTVRNRTGFMNVADEHVYADMAMSNRLFQSKTKNFLDAGQIFFRSGVTTLRAASWHTAFKEFRDLHPTGAISDSDVAEILQRADLLSHNMTRASTSALTTGVMATPAQFYSYWLRLTEMMMSKRLTTLEKARLFGVNAVLYGAPVSAGLLPFTYPLTDGLRNYAQANGYQPGENWYSTAVMEGIPALLGGLISGKGELHKGNIYNIGDRYGVKAPIEDIVDSDKTVLQIMGGAAYNSLGNTWAQTDGLRRLAYGVMHGNMDVLGDLTPEDVIGPFKEITSVNGINQVIAATRYGNWLSKNNAVLHPSSVASSLIYATMGLSEQRNTELWTMSQSLKANKEYENHVFGMFQNRWSLGVQSMQNNDLEQAKAYFKESMSILHQLGYPEEKIPAAMATAMQNAHENAVDRTKYNYYMNMPNKQPGALQKSVEIEKERGER